MIGIGLLVVTMLFDGESASPAEQPPTPPPAEVSGHASWYDWHKGEAAAGPALRKWLGDDWRGALVDVTANGHTVTVKLTDWCQCYKGQQRERLIDLDQHAFAVLEDTWLGVVKVKVTRHGED